MRMGMGISMGIYLTIPRSGLVCYGILDYVLNKGMV